MGAINEKDEESCLLAALDRQISALKSKSLPAEPFLLLIDDQSSNSYIDPNQYSGTPFEPYEVVHLQYLTMVIGGNRGLALPCGNWHDEIESCSPAAITLQIQGPCAPSKGTKASSKKISIADYKRLKQDGHSKRLNDSVEVRSRASSITSLESRSRGPSSEVTLDPKSTETSSKGNETWLLKTKLADLKVEARRLALKNINSPFTNAKLSTNKNTSTPNESVPNVLQAKPVKLGSIMPAMKHPLPPRPQSPRLNGDAKLHHNIFRQSKRRIDHMSLPLSTQVQKRFKNNTSNSFTPKDCSIRRIENSNQPKTSPNATSPKLSIVLPSSSPQFQKDVKPSTKMVKTNHQKSMKIPPLLSPLPPDLDDSPEIILDLSDSENIGIRKSSPTNASQTSTSSNSKSSDVMAKNNDESYSPAYVHPPLLSPDLPPIVEQELSRLQKKNSNSKIVGVRQERVRQTDTLGVLRKNPKVGHPPKTSSDLNKVNVTNKSKSAPVIKDTCETEKKLIVKIKYKKRQAKDIERILRMTPKISSAKFLELEAQRLTNLKDKREVSDNDITPSKAAKLNSNSLPTTNVSKKLSSKKRASDISESLSPPVKRSKILSNEKIKPRSSLDPIRSPALTKNNLLSTPKKSDFKGFTMRKIPSTDSNNAHSPNVSTPVPVDKRSLTSNTSIVNSTNRSDANRYVSEALLLKRKMDAELKTKDMHARQYLSDDETKIGLCTGIECLLAYYSAFSVKKENRPSDRASSWESTIGLLEFVFRNAEPFLLLQTLAAQLNALVKEELNRTYLEHVSITKEASSELLEKIVRNSQSRDRYWALASRGREVLQKMGFAETVGPWTSWRDGRDYFLRVLASYENREKLGWKASFE